MKQLNQGQRFTTDPLEAIRTAFHVEQSDVGLTQGMYLGQHDYTFQADDVGRLVEVVQDMSPGFLSWGFGSVFADLRQQYPDPKPYVVEV
jgi:hypothetical protein